jgi:hypothetical protein
MITNNEKVNAFKKKLDELEQLGSRELVRHLNEEYGAGFPEMMSIECLSDLSNEDGDIDGYLDPCDLVMDLPDLKEFLRWRYRLLLTQKLKSAIFAFENGDVSKLQGDAAELMRCKDLANEIKEISDEFIAVATELICALDESIIEEQ